MSIPARVPASPTKLPKPEGDLAAQAKCSLTVGIQEQKCQWTGSV